jgi:TonB family protein
MCFPGEDEWFGSWTLLRAALGIALAFLVPHPLALGQQVASEDEVKAAYLLNFAKLGEWPSVALPDSSAPLVIGVSGGDAEFLDVLKAVVSGKAAGTHPLQVKAVDSQPEMESCQIIFFRASTRKHARAALQGLREVGILFVGEDPSFLQDGGMIDLVIDHGTVRFEANADLLDRSQIHFSSKILALAKTGYGTPAASALRPPMPEEGGRKLEHSVVPEYPEIAKQMKLTGTVQLQVMVKPDGSVREVKIVGGHPLLADSLARAVMQWKYQPAPRETTEIVKFTFDAK